MNFYETSQLLFCIFPLKYENIYNLIFLNELARELSKRAAKHCAEEVSLTRFSKENPL